jgi:glycosyltransferase involved in cell wall biosynthesis
MKIGFYAPLKPPSHPAPSGDRRMARLFMAAMAGLGHEVSVISELRSYNKTGDPATEDATAAAARAEIARLSNTWTANPAERPDLLFTYHVYHKAADYLAPTLKARFGIPYLISEASIAPKHKSGPWAAGYAQAAGAIQAADAILAITTLDRACLVNFVGETKVHTFPPFLDSGPLALAAAQRQAHRQALAAKWNLPQDRPWLLAVGMMRDGDKLASYRRLAEVLKLARTVPWQMLIVGNGPERGTVEAAFSGIQNCTTFLGQLGSESLNAVYAASDIYVWPAVNEAYGMALLEAQAAGVPVLSVATRGVPDIVRHDETGVLTASDDPQVMAQALLSLLKDTPRREAMARRARDHVTGNLSMKAAQERLASILDRLVLAA